MYAIKSGAVQWHQSEIVQKNYKYMIDDNNSDSNYGDHLKQNQGKFCGIELTLSCGETILVDKILLATGFGKKLPGGAMIQHDLVDRADLPVSAFCGFPVINENLQWHKRIFVAGAMADARAITAVEVADEDAEDAGGAEDAMRNGGGGHGWRLMRARPRKWKC